MNRDPNERRHQLEFLTRVVSLYYLEEKTQAEVARELGISRQKVQRLLRQCREEGLVEINIRTRSLVALDLEKQLRELFNLKEAVVANSHADEVEQRRSVAFAAANYLRRHLVDGMAVAVGMGRNTGEIPDFFHPSVDIRCDFIAAMGGSPHVGESINPNNICSRLAARCKGSAKLLYAPAFVESRRVRDIVVAQEAVGHTLEQARNADMAIVGIGAPNDDGTLVRMDCLSVDEAREIREKGAVGDILGAYFDMNGVMIPTDLHQRLVGLTLEDIRKIDTVVAVVSERDKSRAILGALRTGVLQALITDFENAQEVLRLAESTESRT